MRQNQFLKWFQNIFENFEQDANRTKNNRQCISQRFPDNNPGLINRLGFIQSFIRTTGPILKVRLNSQKCVTFWTFFFKSLEKGVPPQDPCFFKKRSNQPGNQSF